MVQRRALNRSPRKPSGVLASYALLLLVGCAVAGITYLLYLQTERLLQDRLKERLRTVATAAALAFSPEDLERIRSGEAVGSESFVRVTRKLQDVRRVSGDIFYAYILRPTAQPHVFEYVADADSMDPAAKIDLNCASLEELQQVPGIGPKRAEAIVELREEKGRFTSVQELDDLPGARGSITPETYKLFTV